MYCLDISNNVRTSLNNAPIISCITAASQLPAILLADDILLQCI